MKRICVLSDTHSTCDDRLLKHLNNCDEIWHAGDIGNESVIGALDSVAPVRAVYGNIDSHKIRAIVPEIQKFTVEGMKILMMHIAGYPGRYNKRSRKIIQELKPDIFICGHSHILKVINDKKLGHLHINPGAAGKSGFHTVRTIVRFTLNEKQISDMEVVEMKR